MLVEQTPLAILENAPKEEVESPRACRNRSDSVCTVGPDTDVLVIVLPDSQSPVIGLGKAGPPIVVAKTEHTENEMIVPLPLRISQIL